MREKFQRQEKYQKRHRKPNRRSKRLSKMHTRHHDQAKCRGGSYAEWNIYKLSAEHHRAYHLLFDLRTFSEAAQVLLRMQEIHRNQVH